MTMKQNNKRCHKKRVYYY